jgi:predicted dehydrogenase
VDETRAAQSSHFVFAQTFQKFPQLVKGPVFDVEDSAYGMIRFETGAVMQFQIAWAGNQFLDVPRSAWGDREIFRTSLYGPNASIRLIDRRQNHPDEPLMPLTMVRGEDGRMIAENIPLDPKTESSFLPQMRNFLRAILGEEGPTNSSIQAVQLMEMLDAVYRSTQTGHEVLIGEAAYGPHG